MRFKIETKIGLVFLILLAEIFALMGIFAMINRTHEQIIHKRYEEIEGLDLIKSLQLALIQAIMPANDFLVAGGDSSEFENFKVLSARIEDLIEQLEKLEFRKSEGKELLSQVKEKYFQVERIALQIFSISNPIGNPRAGRLMEEMDKIADSAAIDLEKFHQFTHKEINTAEMEMMRVRKKFDIVIVVGILSNIALILGSMFFFRCTISSPINSIREVVLKVGKGNLAEKVNITSNDEIGDLAASFDKMTEDLQKTTVSKEYVDSIVKSMIDTLIVITLEGNIQMVNQALLNLLGYREQELIDKPAATIFAEPGSKDILFQRLFEKGYITNYEIFFKTKSGDKILMLLRGTMLKVIDCPHMESSENCPAFKEKGRHCEKNLGVICTAEDITERKRAEEAIQTLVESTAGSTGQESFDKIVNNLCRWLDVEYAIVGETADANIKVLSMQKVGEIIHGDIYSLDNAPCGNVVKEEYCVYPKGVFKIFPNDKQLIELGVEGYVGICLRGRNNRPIGILCAMSRRSLHLPPRTKEIMRIMAAKATAEIEHKRAGEALKKAHDELERRVHERTLDLARANEALQLDIAERKRTEEALRKVYIELKETQDQLIQAEKAHVIGTLASGIAHEVKNPLGVIKQGADYLEEHLPLSQGNVSEVLQMIKNNIERADNIVRTLVDFSRASKLNTRLEDVNSILESSLVLVQHKVKLENIRIVKELKKDLPRILIDKGRLEQVFVNIFLNAIQAMPQDGRLTIRSYLTKLKEPRSGTEVRSDDYFKVGEKAVAIEVEDTGTGISEENLNRVFDPFFTTKEIGKGSGLGLSVTRNIIAMHRGLIEIKSKIGQGTRVIIYLKIARGEQYGEEKGNGR
jgi:PAS domain S-box-containing protein